MNCNRSVTFGGSGSGGILVCGQTNFKNTNETTARSTKHKSTEMSEPSELAGMLLDDRKALETELREERRVRAEEMAEMAEETRAETARRDEAMRAQMDLIRGLVEGVRGEGGGDRRPPTHDLAKLTDIEAYLVTFERLMTTYEVPDNRMGLLATRKPYCVGTT